MSEGLPDDEFRLRLLGAFAAAIAIGLFGSGCFAGIGEEKEAYGSYQEQNK